jgi:putative restriction endonuclease
MKPVEVERLFTELRFQRDARRPPDDSRRIQFQRGWQDATVTQTGYAESTLGRLTWRNLGYRFGQRDGPQSLDDRRRVSSVGAVLWPTVGASIK